MRDYGVAGQFGLEDTPQEYVRNIVELFSQIHRVLKDTGTVWLNLGDTYSAHKDCKSVSQSFSPNSVANVISKGKSVSRNSKTLKLVGLKNKDLVGIPWRVALALQEFGWYLRQDIIWHKPNPMPESVKDRCTKSHEYIFLLTKSARYYFDHKAILEPAAYDGRKDTFYKGGSKDMNCTSHERWPNKIRGFKEKEGETGLSPSHHGSSIPTYPARNKRDVWTVSTKPFKEAHFATYPPELITPCILAGCPENGIVLDPFIGSGTTAVVAKQNNRNYIGFELNTEYKKIADKRINPV